MIPLKEEPRSFIQNASLLLHPARHLSGFSTGLASFLLPGVPLHPDCSKFHQTTLLSAFSQGKCLLTALTRLTPCLHSAQPVSLFSKVPRLLARSSLALCCFHIAMASSVFTVRTSLAGSACAKPRTYPARITFELNTFLHPAELTFNVRHLQPFPFGSDCSSLHYPPMLAMAGSLYRLLRLLWHPQMSHPFPSVTRRYSVMLSDILPDQAKSPSNYLFAGYFSHL